MAHVVNTTTLGNNLSTLIYTTKQNQVSSSPHQINSTQKTKKKINKNKTKNTKPNKIKAQNKQYKQAR